MSDQQQATPMPDHPPAELEFGLFDAIRLMVSKATGAQDARDADSYAAAALKFSQAAVILDPKLVAPQGVPADALHPPVPYIQKDKTAPTARTAGIPSSGGPGAQR